MKRRGVGRLVFRSVGAPGERYPAWLAAFRDRSGVYLIRERGRLVYVGESHTGRLLKTLTRHFSGWDRRKTYWRGRVGGGDGADPGFTYDRAASTVALEVTAPSEAITRERQLIEALSPRDNLLAEVPF